MQKIAIARTLYKNAPLVVLDEPTASLDPYSEYEVYSRLISLRCAFLSVNVQGQFLYFSQDACLL